jgi:hypothetical protein
MTPSGGPPSKHGHLNLVTPETMRVFALDCSHWAAQARNPSDREIILRVARMWMDTASCIERQVEDGWELVNPDLRAKLD